MTQSEIKGWFGEVAVKMHWWLFLKRKGYNLISNKYFATPMEVKRLSLTQVDHILVGPRGVFVIEVKNYSLPMYGKASDREWTAVAGKKKLKISNPMRQNALHVRAIEPIVYDFGVRVESLVLFVGAGHLISEPIVGVSNSSLGAAILDFNDQKLTPEEIAEVTAALIKGALPETEALKQAHRFQLGQLYGDRRSA